MLFSKLESTGISSKMLNALYSFNNNIQSYIRLNGNLIKRFEVTSGLKQGCLLSPLLFHIFINCLIEFIKCFKIGIKLDDDNIISIFLYADDVVF